MFVIYIMNLSKKKHNATLRHKSVLIFVTLHLQTTGELDIVHTYLTQTMGIMMFGTALVFFYLRRSQDQNVKVALCISRIIVSYLLFSAH